MAQIDYNFPGIDMDWLGQLPARMEEGRIRSVRQSLGDIDISSDKSANAAISRLLQQGDLKGAIELQDAITKRRAVDLRYAGDLAGAAALQGYLDKKKAAEATPDIGAPVPRPPVAAPPTEAPNWPEPPAPGGPSVVPPGTPIPQVPPRPPGPRAEALSPSDEIIAAAQAAGLRPPAPSPIQYAQAGGAPVPAPAPPPGPPRVPGFTPEMLAPVPGARPGGPPVAPTAPTYPNPREQATQTGNQQINMAIESLRDHLRMGGRRDSPAVRALEGQIRAGISQISPNALPPLERAYSLDKVQRIIDGRPEISFEDYKAREATTDLRTKEVHEIYKGHRADNEKAHKVINSLDIMEKLLANPNAITGPGTEGWAKAMGVLGTASQLAKSYGIEVPDISRIAAPAELSQAIRSLTNNLVTDALGGLARTVSDADRDYMDKSYPGILMNPKANAIVIQSLRLGAERQKKIFEAVNAYRRNTKYPDLDAAQLDKIIADVRENEERLFIKRDGTKTELAKRIDAIATEPPVEPGTAQNSIMKMLGITVGPTPPTPARPITKEDEGRIGTDPAGNLFIIQNGRRVPYTPPGGP